MDLRLFSPHTYHQLHGFHYTIKVFNVKMVLNNYNSVVPINIQEYKSPIIYNSYVTSAQNKHHGPLLRLDTAFIGLDYLDLFGYLRTYK